MASYIVPSPSLTDYISESINDLDWTSTPDMQSILAVGFLHHVELLCQQRMTYFDDGPCWSMCWRIEIGGYALFSCQRKTCSRMYRISFIPYPICDSIWLANGSLLIGAGHQMLLYDQSPAPQSLNSDSETLFEYVARQNGPLDDYHPQMLLQCLLWGEYALGVVKSASDILHRESRISERYHRKPLQRPRAEAW